MAAKPYTDLRISVILPNLFSDAEIENQAMSLHSDLVKAGNYNCHFSMLEYLFIFCHGMLIIKLQGHGHDPAFVKGRLAQVPYSK